MSSLKIYNVVSICIMILAFLIYIRNSNVYKNRMLIINAIFTYRLKNLSGDADTTISSMLMEPYITTILRVWDWGYKRIIPPDKYEVIKDYIEKPEKTFKTQKIITMVLIIAVCLSSIMLISHPEDLGSGELVEIKTVPKTEVAAVETTKEPEVVEQTIVAVKEETKSEPIPESVIDVEPAQYIAKTVYGEARGCSKEQQAAVIWCILNRVDYGYSNSGDANTDIIKVVTQRNQFHGYNAAHPVTDDIYALVIDVLSRWEREKAGETDVGRILPKGYLWFHGDGAINYFRDSNGNVWDWSLDSPYTN